MARRNQFKVDAESVQGNPGAEITFRKLTVAKREQYRTDRDYNDLELVREHIIDWHGIEDDNGNEIPSPKDEPGADAALYVDEITEMARLLFQGPDGIFAKN
jgi:hypothetical protein